ncbi:hypothetical protein DFJ73DRAFT_805473 [Zopfochytrium polystomum]|nr:hypothetical protein DFJ73DRAFT_805473 [Zopfochytrium polystomum]
MPWTSMLVSFHIPLSSFVAPTFDSISPVRSSQLLLTQLSSLHLIFQPSPASSSQDRIAEKVSNRGVGNLVEELFHHATGSSQS